jgi:hypothetical protein
MTLRLTVLALALCAHVHFASSAENTFPLDGNVGLGTAAVLPAQRLDVRGSVAVSGSLGISTTTPAFKLDLASTNGIGLRMYPSSGSKPNFTGCSHNDLVMGTYIQPDLYPHGFISFGHSQDSLRKFSIGVASDPNMNVNTTFSPIMTFMAGGSVYLQGNLSAKELRVTPTGFPDYVFGDSYKLRPLIDLEKFITTNKHLPGIPTAKTVEKEGLGLAENAKMQLEKIEELTLYIIKINKTLEAERKRNDELEQRLKNIEAALKK